MLWCLLIYGFLFVINKSYISKYIYICINSVVACFAILCKQQDILIVFPIVLIFLMLLKHLGMSSFIKIIWVILFLSIITISLIVNKGGQGVTAFNVINKSILVNSKDPCGHLRKMGFGEEDIERVKESIGQSAFQEKGSSVWEQYKNYYTRTNEIKILAREPQIIFKLVEKKSKALFKDVNYLGNYTKESGAKPGEKTRKNRFWYNVKRSLYKSNFAFYIVVIMFSICTSAFSVKNSYVSKDIKKILLVYVMLPCSNILRYITVILGDGVEDVKHFFILNFEFDFIYIVNICLVAYIINLYIRHSFWHK